MKARQLGYQRERGERQEKRILEALAVESLTAYQLAEQLHLSRWRVHVHLTRLMKSPNRFVRVVSYQLGAGRPRLVYGLGTGRNVSISEFQQSRVLKVLASAPAPWSAYQIAERMSMGYGIVKIYMRGLKKAGKVHVAQWIWSNKTPMALYLAGRGEDVPKPTKRPAPANVPSACIFAALGL